MSTIFSANGQSSMGKANTINLERDVELSYINFKTFNDTFDASNPLAIIQAVSFDQKTNHQFSLSLRQTIYLYVYGNQIGDVSITGFLFSGNCNTNNNGFDAILQFYNTNRLSSKTEPVELVLGKTPFKGFLTSLQIHPTENDKLITPFVMTVKALPGDKIKDALGAQSGTPNLDSGSPGFSENSVASRQI